MSLGAEILDKSVNHKVAQRPSRYHPGGLAHPCSHPQINFLINRPTKT